jgi:hypothetical protein
MAVEIRYPRMVFGYPLEIYKKGNQYIAEVSELGIKEKSESKGSAIRQIFKSVKEKLKESPFDPKPPDDQFSYHHSVQLRMVKVNQKITNFGFSVLADDLTMPDIVKLEQIANSIDLNKEYSKTEYEEIENEIADVFSKYLRNPHYRALNMTSLIKNTDHVKKFSHIIEQAYISFFRGEYISTVMCLIPVVEGILLSLYGFEANSPKPSERQLLNRWAELEYKYGARQMIHPFMVDEYIRAFIELWEQTFFQKHQRAEDIMFFNRHYVAHLMGEGNFYTRNNAYKLITMIDLLVHVIAACTGKHTRFHFDTTDKEYILRCILYQSLYESSFRNINERIMRTHEFFKGY